jgi:hypothetical protein
VIQLAPPLTIGVPEFQEIEQILRGVLTEATNRAADFRSPRHGGEHLLVPARV